MASFSGLGIGLSFLFGCMVMGFAAELYYLFWVKKRITTGEQQYTTYATVLCSIFCWKKTKIGTQEVAKNSRNQETNDQDRDLEFGTTNNNNNDVLLKGFDEDSAAESSSSVKLEEFREGNNSDYSEFMRLHNLRFLSTIKEETKEDLESEDSKSRCFSDLTLILTPLSSPRPSDPSNGFSFNPLFESEIKSSVKTNSPPPKFKFLRDAEEKLIRKLIEEAEKRKVVFNEEKNGSFLHHSVAASATISV